MTLPSGAVQLSVVIPVYNEERNIRETLRRLEAFFAVKGTVWEVLVVSDGSKDRTVEIVEDVRKSKPGLPLQLIRSDRNHGKGFTSRQGILQSRGRYVLLTDADLSSPIKESDHLIAELETGADVAIGSRALRKKDCDVRQSLKRRISGRIFNFFVQLLVLPGIHDSQCGFKCFTREAAQKLFSAQKLDGFSFDVEVLYLARRFGYKIAEVPMMWSQGADSRVSLFRDSILMLKDLFKIKKMHAG